MILTWRVCGTYLESMWDLLGEYVILTWRVCGRCLLVEYVILTWRVCGRHL